MQPPLLSGHFSLAPRWLHLHVPLYCVMFLVMGPHISWLKICDSSDAAVEDKALDK